MRKKLLAILLALTAAVSLTVGLAACDNSGKDNTGSNTEQNGDNTGSNTEQNGDNTGDDSGDSGEQSTPIVYSEGLEFSLSEDETCYAVAGKGTCQDTDIYIPKTYNNKPVTSIGDYAFYGCRSLESITIPNSVTSIGDGAFAYCSSLERITIPDSVTSIGRGVFSDCTSLESITVENGNTKYHSAGNCIVETARKTLVAGCKNSIIPTDGSVTSIGNVAFEYCSSLESITIPNSVTSIGDGAFGYCYSLKSITIPDSVTSIGRGAFSGCSSLESITIPNSVTDIGSYAFDSCSSLTIYCEASPKPSGWNSKWNYYGSCPVVWNCKNNDKDINGYAYAVVDGVRYSLKEGVATVIRQPQNITTANIPTSVTYKGETYNVTSIESSAFYGCSSLESITVEEGNTAYHSAGNCIIETESKTLVVGCKSSIIPTDGSVTSIGDRAFYCCSSLENIIIPDSVASIGSYAFYGCSSLTSITIPNGVTSIEYGSFGECISLESITIPDSVTNLGDAALEDCWSLTSVAFGENIKLTDIGNRVFRGCSSLTSITIPDSVTSIGESAFEYCRSLESITYNGTKSQWYGIEKGIGWNYDTGNYVIHCTDGDIAKS